MPPEIVKVPSIIRIKAAILSSGELRRLLVKEDVDLAGDQDELKRWAKICQELSPGVGMQLSSHFELRRFHTKIHDSLQNVREVAPSKPGRETQSLEPSSIPAEVSEVASKSQDTNNSNSDTELTKIWMKRHEEAMYRCNVRLDRMEKNGSNIFNSVECLEKRMDMVDDRVDQLHLDLESALKIFGEVPNDTVTGTAGVQVNDNHETDKEARTMPRTVDTETSRRENSRYAWQALSARIDALGAKRYDFQPLMEILQKVKDAQVQDKQRKERLKSAEDQIIASLNNPKRLLSALVNLAGEVVAVSKSWEEDRSDTEKIVNDFEATLAELNQSSQEDGRETETLRIEVENSYEPEEVVGQVLQGSKSQNSNPAADSDGLVKRMDEQDASAADITNQIARKTDQVHPLPNIHGEMYPKDMPERFRLLSNADHIAALPVPELDQWLEFYQLDHIKGREVPAKRLALCGFLGGRVHTYNPQEEAVPLGRRG